MVEAYQLDNAGSNGKHMQNKVGLGRYMDFGFSG